MVFKRKMLLQLQKIVLHFSEATANLSALECGRSKLHMLRMRLRQTILFVIMFATNDLFVNTVTANCFVSD